MLETESFMYILIASSSINFLLIIYSAITFLKKDPSQDLKKEFKESLEKINEKSEILAKENRQMKTDIDGFKSQIKDKYNELNYMNADIAEKNNYITELEQNIKNIYTSQNNQKPVADFTNDDICKLLEADPEITPETVTAVKNSEITGAEIVKNYPKDSLQKIGRLDTKQYQRVNKLIEDVKSVHISDQITEKQGSMKKVKDWNNDDIKIVLKEFVSKENLNVIETDKWTGTDIISKDPEYMVESITDNQEFIRDKLIQLKNINKSNVLKKSLDEWRSEDFIEYFKTDPKVGDTQIEIMNAANLDGMDTLTKYHDEILDILQNDSILFKNVKMIKTINDLQDSADLNGLNDAISKMQIEISKLKSDNKIVNDKLESAESNLREQTKELKEVTDSYNNMKNQNLELTKINKKLKEKLEENNVYNKMGQRIDGNTEMLHEEVKALQKDKEKYTHKNRELKKDLQDLKDQYIKLRDQKEIINKPEIPEIAKIKSDDDLTTSLQKTLTATISENEQLSNKVRELENKLIGSSRMANKWQEYEENESNLNEIVSDNLKQIYQRDNQISILKDKLEESNLELERFKVQFKFNEQQKSNLALESRNLNIKMADMTKELHEKQNVSDSNYKIRQDNVRLKKMLAQEDKEREVLSDKVKSLEIKNSNLQNKILVFESTLESKDSEIKDTLDTKNKVLTKLNNLESNIDSGYKSKWENALEENRSLRDKAKQFDSTKKQLELAERDCDLKTRKNKELQRSLEELHYKSLTITSDLNRLKKENSNLIDIKDKYYNIKIEFDNIKKTNLSLKKDKEELVKKCDSLDKVSRNYLDVSNSQTAKINTLRKEFDKIKKDHNDNMNNYIGLKKAHDLINSKYEELVKIHDNVTERLNSTQYKYDKLRKELQDLVYNKKIKESDLSKVNELYSQIDGDYKNLNKEFSRLQQDNSMNIAARDELERQLNSLKDMFKSTGEDDIVGSKGGSSNVIQNSPITEQFQKECERENEVLDELSKEMDKLMSKSAKMEFNFDMDMDF